VRPKTLSDFANERSGEAFMIGSSGLFLGRDCPRPRNHGARSSQLGRSGIVE
jgi:hypothetical protein